MNNLQQQLSQALAEPGVSERLQALAQIGESATLDQRKEIFSSAHDIAEHDWIGCLTLLAAYYRKHTIKLQATREFTEIAMSNLGKRVWSSYHEFRRA